MSEVKYITSEHEIPGRERFVLVMYGPEKKTITHSRGVTFHIQKGKPNDTIKIVEFHSAIEGARGVAKCEGIANVYVLDAT
jgi:hypothetical protein